MYCLYANSVFFLAHLIQEIRGVFEVSAPCKYIMPSKSSWSRPKPPWSRLKWARLSLLSLSASIAWISNLFSAPSFSCCCHCQFILSGDYILLKTAPLSGLFSGRLSMFLRFVLQRTIWYSIHDIRLVIISNNYVETEYWFSISFFIFLYTSL